MEGQENRLVRKYFKCSNCKIFDSSLIKPSIERFKCHYCRNYLKEISESEYKQLKQKLKEKKNKERRENQDEERHRGNSQLHYSRMNINVDNERNNNYRQNNNNNRQQNYNNNRQNNNNNHNNINVNNINSNNNNRQRRGNNVHHNENRRRREHSSERNNPNNVLENVFGNLFRPFSNMANQRNFNMFGQNRNPFRILIQRQNVSNDIFDPIFSTFGSMFNGIFQDNYSSNFRSNYRGNFFNEIFNILERNQAESRRNAHPPTSKENLQKLKQFNMSEKYCKKEKDGKLELPNCCICIDNIELGVKTILLPCGHMFHSDCILTWLKKNNTCPMCRFEIK